MTENAEPAKPLSDHEIKKVRLLHREGLSPEQIAELLDADTWVIKMVLQIMN